MEGLKAHHDEIERERLIRAEKDKEEASQTTSTKIVKEVFEEQIEQEPIIKSKTNAKDEHTVKMQDNQEEKKEEIKSDEQTTEQKFDSFFDELDKKEKDMDYQDTPFYLRQDRPVFTGKETKIPTSPTTRALHFGALGISIVGGTISEVFKQSLGITKPLPEMVGKRKIARYAMTDSNSNRLSNTLCKMRGAALKIGQILSSTEESFIPKSIQQAFDKARQKADIMPKSQVTEMLVKELGADWQKHFKEFNLYPLAAASIGQVHQAVLKNGTKVAVKIQYPNIAESIDSDFINFKRLLKVIGVPETLYLDELIENVSEELHEECNYIIEAEKQRTFIKLVSNDEYNKDYYVPHVYSDLSTTHLMTQEFINGVPIDELHKQSQEIRDRVGGLLLKICLHEVFLFKFMQTDPNPANFYYDIDTDRINLIDMGAAHHYEDKFVNDYFQVVYGAATNDEKRVIEYSKSLGFLTGEENKEMLKAHCKSAMFIGEPFKHKTPYFDFGDSDISKRLMAEIPVMLKNRLSPPPKEVYSLHRKLSGAYFMCIKLRSRVNSRDMFNEVSSRFIQQNSLVI